MNRKEKTALITGANRGLGFEIAKQLGKRGIKVFLGARKEKTGKEAVMRLRKQGISADFVKLDITNSEDILKAVEKLESNCDSLDILINNAAMQSMESQLPSDIKLELLNDFVSTNYIGHVLVTQGFLPLLKKSDSGRIVNMSSSIGSITISGEPNHINDRRTFLGYASTKAALNMFTVLMAKELRETNIKVNSADPGWTKTDLGGEDAKYTVEEGAKPAVWLALLDEEGPTGGFFSHTKMNPW